MEAHQGSSSRLMVRITRYIILLLTTLWVGSGFTQPYMQGYKSIYANPAMVGSLNKGRAQVILQSNEPRGNNYLHRYGYVAVDDLVPKLKGGIGLSYEIGDHFRENYDQYGDVLDLADAWQHQKIKINYSPKVSIGPNYTLAPGIGFHYGKARAIDTVYGSWWSSSKIQVDYEKGTFDYGLLLNNTRGYIGVTRHTAFDYDNEKGKISHGKFTTMQLGYKFPRFINEKLTLELSAILGFGHMVFKHSIYDQILNASFNYDSKFYFGFAFSDAIMPSFGYKNDYFRINFTSKTLLPTNPATNAYYPHELMLEYYFHTPRQKKPKYFKSHEETDNGEKSVSFYAISGINFLNPPNYILERLAINGSSVGASSYIIPGTYYESIPQPSLKIGVRKSINHFLSVGGAFNIDKVAMRGSSFISYYNFIEDQLIFYRGQKIYRWTSLELQPHLGLRLFASKRISMTGLIGFQAGVGFRSSVIDRIIAKVDDSGNLDSDFEQQGFPTSDARYKGNDLSPFTIGAHYGIEVSSRLTEKVNSIIELRSNQYLGSSLKIRKHDPNNHHESFRKNNVFIGFGLNYKIK